MSGQSVNRREFLTRAGVAAGLVVAGGGAGFAVGHSTGPRRTLEPAKASGPKTCVRAVWCLDPTVCDGCRQLHETRQGPSRCATECVVKRSAVKAVNDLDQCGYCWLCPAYYDINSPVGADGLPKKLLCPNDAIVRRLVGDVDLHDPRNNAYEYTIDQSKCQGCGRCVVNCRPPPGNGSIRLQVRHDLCAHCVSCPVATACPAESPAAGYAGAFYLDFADRPDAKGTGAGRTIAETRQTTRPADEQPGTSYRRPTRTDEEIGGGYRRPSRPTR